MKSLHINKKRGVDCLLVILMVVVCVLAVAPLRSSAHSNAVSSITVVNNSNREIRFLYLSSVDQENWSADQLNSASLSNGQSVTLANVTCNGAEIKVIGEDADGCFLSSVISCTGAPQWTITNNTPADCGSE